MTSQDTPAGTAVSEARPATAVSAEPSRARPPAAPSFAWLRGGFLLAGAAQLITISALLSVDPLAATWSALLLAIAPVLLAAVAAFGPRPAARLAGVAAVVALIAGIIGEVTHTGLFFVPALAVLGVGTAKLWQER
jgi:hypothetical protein